MGFTLDSSTNSTCISCSEGCSSCSAEGDCSECGYGYSLTQDGQCTPCADPNCRTCASPDSCDECAPTYGNVEGACKQVLMEHAGADCIRLSHAAARPFLQPLCKHRALTSRPSPPSSLQCADGMCLQCDGDAGFCTSCRGNRLVAKDGVCVNGDSRRMRFV